MLITFSGLDGAGKTTLISWLRTTLEQHDRQTVVFHMNDDVGVYAYLRAARDRLLGVTGRRAHAAPPAADVDVARTPQAERREMRPPLARRIRNAILWSRLPRRLIYPLDLALFLVYRLYVERLTGRVLIMDRYFYDTLVDVADGRSWRWLRLLERITPTPTVPVFLDITPEESYARKGEYTVEYLRRRWVAYKEVFSWLPSSVSLQNEDLDITKAVLDRVVKHRVLGE